MRSLHLLLAASAVVVALATPLPSRPDGNGLLQRRGQPPGYWTWLKEQTDADYRRYAKAQRLPTGEYEQSQEAADQCFQHEMLNTEDGWLAISRDDTLRICGEKHGFAPNPNPSDPEWRQRMQAAANRAGWEWAIMPEALVHTVPGQVRPEDPHAEADRAIEKKFGFRPQRGADRPTEADRAIEKNFGFRPKLGPEQPVVKDKVMKDKSNKLQFSMSDMFKAVGRTFFPGANGRKKAPPTTARYHPRRRPLKLGF